MDNEGKGLGGEELRAPSYWLDAYEDIPCDFADFDADTSIVPDSAVDNISHNDFFGGIEHILDSIKNGSGLPLPLPQVSGTNTNANGNSTLIGNGILDCPIVDDDWFQNENGISGLSKVQAEGEEKGSIVQSKEVVENGNGDCKRYEADNGNGEQRLVHSLREDGVQKVENRGGEWSRERGSIDSEERCSKRAKLGNYKNDRPHSSRGQWQYHNKDRERGSSRKRSQRDWDDGDRRDRDNGRRREHYNSNRRDGRDRDWRDREAKGFWERDRTGSNELVFRVGTWEAERNKEGKVANEKNQECNGKDEVKPEEPKEKIPEEHARQYQLDVLEQAKNTNTIAFLETGAGKTLIAVLLLKSICNDLQMQNKKMLAVFLVPKVPLVYQQAEVIRERTGFQVGHYCGEMGQDFWDARRWQREFETKQVLVMTAQILLNILRHSIIKMEAINLLILDECHHAVKKHPYSLVMSEFYHTTQKEKRPSVFGMTASPVNLKGVSSQVDCAIKIRNLESKLDSIVCTIKDRKELEKHVPMPSEVVVEYDKAASLWSLHEQIKQMEAEVEEAAKSSCRRSKWQFMGARDAGAKEELRQVYGVSERTECDGAANLIQKLRAINYALGELGQWCAY